MAMPPEIMVALATFVTVFLVARLAMGSGRDGRDFDPEAEARRFIERRIDEHLDELARRYLETGSEPEADPSPRFGEEIETFIADVVLRDAPVAVDDEDVLAAVRELVVLERAYVYDQVLARVLSHLPRVEPTG